MDNSLFVFIGLVLFSCVEKSKIKDHLNLNSKLAGKWSSVAFDGELHEEWTLANDGWMIQKGYYIEKNDTSYAPITQIQKVLNTNLKYVTRVATKNNLTSNI